MSLLTYKLIAALLLFLVSIVSILYPIRFRSHPAHHHGLELADAFASGIFLGAALFHMLPDARLEFASVLGVSKFPLSEFICACGFMLLLFFERLSSRFFLNSISYAFAIIIIIHSFIEGMALGMNTIESAAFVLFIAIFVHKSSESFALAVILNRSLLNLKTLISIIFVFSLMSPLGVLIGAESIKYVDTRNGLILASVFNAFAAGTFLYMSTLHHINHHHKLHDKEGLIEFAALFFGLIIMALVALWA